MRNKLIILSFALLLSFTAFSQNGDDVQISIYPNPAVDFIMVQLDGDLTNPEFELTSMIGNKLQINPEEMGMSKHKISVKNLATGYYFLVVKDDEKRFKKAYKFLKN